MVEINNLDYKKIQTFLWVVPSWPFPPENGAAVARANLIKNIALQGYVIDILVISNDVKNSFEPPPNITLGTVYTIKTKEIKNLFLKKAYLFFMSLFNYQSPVIMLRFTKKNILSQFKKIINLKVWDYIVYDGLHTAAPQMKLGRFKIPSTTKLIYRAHNVESEIWSRMASLQKNPLKKYFLINQAKCITQFERSLIKSMDGVAAVSQVDLEKLKQLASNIKGRVVPISFDFHKPKAFPKSHKKIQIMFLGSLDWPPNKDGLIWFLSKVWKKVLYKRKDIHLSIAGSGNCDWLKLYTDLPNINFLGKIEHIENLYQESCLVIVPIFYGSGTRVKIIEACHYGRPCISTSIGADGTGLKHQKSYYCAESIEEWVEFLTNLELDSLKNLGVHAFHEGKQLFAHKIAVIEFLKLLHS